MSKVEITGVTVSVEFGFEGDYGKGTKSFASVQAKYPDPEDVAGLDNVMSDGLDMYFAAWQTLLAARYGTGVVGGTEFKEAMSQATRRVAQVRKILGLNDGNSTGSNDGQQS